MRRYHINELCKKCNNIRNNLAKTHQYCNVFSNNKSVFECFKECRFYKLEG